MAVASWLEPHQDKFPQLALQKYYGMFLIILDIYRNLSNLRDTPNDSVSNCLILTSFGPRSKNQQISYF
jgi:hypothetical protein